MVISTHDISEREVYDLLAEVHDPEIPVLSVIDLGIVRAVHITDDAVIVDITPTYSGCPAIDAIAFDIKLKLTESGYPNVVVNRVLSPAWTTEWMTETGKQKLNAYGIAPPTLNVPACPQCGSADTKLLSMFGSTSCKALHQCNSCKEPFDLFKCH